MKNIWEAKKENFHIIVHNEWDFSGKNEEKILINGKIFHKKNGNFMKESFAEATGKKKIFCVDGHEITVIFWSKWHLCGAACKILLDGEKIGGDSIVITF